MKIEKTYELLNSEGPIISIEKVDGHWSFKFIHSSVRVITSPQEILDFICNRISIEHPSNGIVYRFGDFSMSMKGDSPVHLQRIVKTLLQEEIENCNDLEYFTKTYC